MTPQPNWKLIANLGDADPIEHGGYFVFVDKTGVYPPEVELWQETAEDSETETWTVSWWILEPCTYQGGILSDNPYHPELSTWFAGPGSLQKLARFSGIEEQELIALFCSADPGTRAQAWRLVADYYGPDELDPDPSRYTRAEIKARYTLLHQDVKEA